MGDHPPGFDNFLAKDVYVIITKPVAPFEEIQKKLPDHLARQVQLERDGIMFAAGPLFEDGAERAHAGMIVVRAGSFAEADAIAAEDPFHKAGLREYTIQRWRINEGSYTVTISYSDQKAEIA
jgi:uncharacterized protein YciI